jgi:uncharacterized protein YdiU (UPF0061 family)
MEAYDPQAVFSSIDQQGRYAYRNQPLIAQWNLARLAETLLPLMVGDGDDKAAEQAVAEATAVLEDFSRQYQQHLLRGQRAKLGLAQDGQASDADDGVLVNDWLELLHAQAVDFTLGWRRLADAAAGNEAALLALFAEPSAVREWLQRWRARCAAVDRSPTDRAEGMRRASPWIIPRNHRVEEALEAASGQDDLGPFESLLAALRDPYEEKPEHARFAEPAPAAMTASYQTFCGT